MNKKRQEEQMQYYNKNARADRKVLENDEPIYVRNTRKNIWEPGTIISRPNPPKEPRTYHVNMGGKTYQRTREHLKTRNADSPKPNKPPGDTGSQETNKQTTDGDSRPLPTPYVRLQRLDQTKLNLGQEATTPSCAANYEDKFKPKIYITRAGRTTKFQEKYND